MEGLPSWGNRGRGEEEQRLDWGLDEGWPAIGGEPAARVGWGKKERGRRKRKKER